MPTRSSPGRCASARCRPTCSPPSESIFALCERPHRAARQPRRGRALRRPGLVPERVLRAAPAARTPRRATASPSPVRRSSTSRTASSIRLLVDDEPFDVRYGDLRSHERVLDLRDGVLRRHGGVVLPGGATASASHRPASCRSHSERSPRSCTRSSRSTSGVRVVVQSELVANEPVPAPVDPDPRAGCAADRAAPLGVACAATSMARDCSSHSTQVERAAHGGRDGPRLRRARRDSPFSSESSDDVARVTATVRAEARREAPDRQVHRVRVVERQRSLPALRAQAAAALAEAKVTGWDEICAAAAGLPRRASGRLPTSRSRATPSCSRPLRFALFQLLQAGGRAELRAIPSKGLTGPGYDGHTFWDSESLRAAGAHLHGAGCRARRPALATLDARPRARARRRRSGCSGAVFPWRTIRGEECSGYWPAGTAAFHIGADIADAAIRYVDRHGRPGVRSATTASSCSSRRRAVALARTPRRSAARSASTA